MFNYRSWLMVGCTVLNVAFIVCLPRVIASCRSGGAIDEWYTRGPPRRLQIFLSLPVATFVMNKVSPWLTAAIPMENPYCSCKLTRACSS